MCVCVRVCAVCVCSACTYLIVPISISIGTTRSVDATVLNIVEGRVHFDRTEHHPQPRARPSRATDQRKQAATGSGPVRGGLGGWVRGGSVGWVRGGSVGWVRGGSVGRWAGWGEGRWAGEGRVGGPVRGGSVGWVRGGSVGW